MSRKMNPNPCRVEYFRLLPNEIFGKSFPFMVFLGKVSSFWRRFFNFFGNSDEKHESLCWLYGLCVTFGEEIVCRILVKWKKLKKCKYLLLRCIVFQTFKNSLIVRSRQLFWIPSTLWTQKSGWNFFMDFSFFTHRIFVKNLWKFISQMGNPLGVYETNYKVKKVKKIYHWGKYGLL